MFDNQFPPINWQKTVKIAQWASFLTLFLYVSLESSAAIDADSNRVLAYQKISGMIRELAVFVIDFARPFLEIILFFLIVHWVLKRFDIQPTIPPINDWKVANIIVLLVIGSFIFATLRGLNGATYLKDVALVVLGFYFGRSVVKVA
jgi:hypothetical protein